MSATGNVVDALAPEAAQLFRYLRELQQLQHVVVRDSARYKARGGSIDYLEALPDHEAVQVAVPDADTSVDAPILTVLRLPPPTEPPKRPTSLHGAIRGDVGKPGSEVMFEPLETISEAELERDQVTFDQWHRQWLEWSQRERRDAAIRDLYVRLFSMREQLSAAPQDWELLLGIGRMRIHDTTDPLDRHLLVLPMKVDVDPVTAALHIHAPDDPEVSVELDMLAPGELTHPAAGTELSASIADCEPVHPMLKEQWADALRAFVHQGTAAGRYSDHGTEDHATPTLSLSPALIFRPRNRNALLRALDEIANALEECETLPDGIRALVDPGAVHTGLESAAEQTPGAVHEVDGEYYLPLPVNGEQRTVLQRVDSRPLTLVQGPPGTGKTHTAAALIAHLLAQGKRILVTAQSQQALREVREKLPRDIQDLVVSVLGGDRTEMNSLRASVNAISLQAQDFDRAFNEAAMEQSLAAIDRLSRERAQLRTQLVQAGERESIDHSTPFGSATYAEVAQRTKDEEAQLPWATTLLPEATVQGAPPDHKLVTEYRDLVTRVATDPLTDEAEAGPDEIPALPSMDHLESLLAALEQADLACAQDQDVRTPPGFKEAVADDDRRHALRGHLRGLHEVLSILSGRREPWVPTAIDDIQNGKTQQWHSRRQQIAELTGRAQALLPQAAAGGSIDISAVDAELRPMVEQLLDHTRSAEIKVDATGQPRLGMLASKRVRAAKPLFVSVRIGGRPPTTHQDFTALRAHFELEDCLQALDQAWPAGTAVSQEDSAAERLAWHADETRVLDQVLALVDKMHGLDSCLQSAGLPRTGVMNLASVDTALRHLDVIERRRSAENAHSRLEQQIVALRDSAPHTPCVAALGDALNERDRTQVTHAYRHAQAVREAQIALVQREAVRRDLTARHPRLAAAIDESWQDPAWDERLANLSRAWATSAAHSWLDDRERFDPNAIQARIAAIDVAIREEVSAVSGRRAWAAAVDRLTPSKKADLQYYSQLVKSYGKGTGKRAGYLQREIRKALANCRDAVPVWIMPLHQVADSQQMVANAFDVVLVDEASQAGLEALFLQILAPKLVIVGDDKQVSPSAVGVEVDKVQALADRYLAGNRYKAAFADPGRSLFDEAKMRYPDLITLREHRRCVPDIIGFSNEVAYEPDGVPLKPVREPGASALEPVIARFCADGYQEGTSSNSRNPVEAEGIVAAIHKMIADPAYDGKTIGVISLLGTQQAKLIERKLLETLPTEEIVAREIRCGDSASFQGAERDVILLSLVAAPGVDRRPVALTRDTYVQRYNVAASRAKDQMILFYSIPRELLGNKEDMRYQLVEYCERVAARRGTGIPGAQVDPLPGDTLAHPPFDSLFEQRVCNHLINRGYVVVPQYESLGYRIDLVVVGALGKIAVECDGDFWHGPDRFAADMARQRDLERCGWTFYRILESDFILDPERALAPLLDLLEARDILPGARLKHEVEAGHAASVETSPPELHSGQEGDVTASATADAKIVSSSQPSASAGSRLPRSTEQVGVLTDGMLAAEVDRPARSIELEPYTEALLEPLPSEAMTRQEIVEAMTDVATVEGPIIGSRLMRVVHKARGHSRLKKPSDRIYLDALAKAVSDGRLLRAGDDPEAAVYWLPSQAPVRLRELGPRTLFEVPPNEVIEIIRTVIGQHPDPGGDSGYVRAVLNAYGLKRMTDKSAQYVERLASAVGSTGHSELPLESESLGMTIGGDDAQ